MAITSTVINAPSGVATLIYTAPAGQATAIIKRTGARAYLGPAGVTATTGWPMEDSILEFPTAAAGSLFAFVQSPTGANATFYILSST